MRSPLLFCALLLACDPTKSDSGNRPPGAPEVRIEPSRPTTTDPLVAVVAREASDPDGDRLTYRTTWSLVGGEDVFTGETLEASATSKGQVWELSVQAEDGLTTGPAGTARATIENSPPTVTVTLLPADAGAALRAEAVPGDPDEDPVALQFSWYRDGALTDFTTDTVPADTTLAGETWRVEVVGNDGEADSLVAGAEILLSAGGGLPPEIRSLTLSPEVLTREVTVRAVVDALDPEGAALTFTYTWLVDGAVVAEGPEAELNLAPYTRGEGVSVRAVASDGALDSAPATSPAVPIDNSVPRISSVVVDGTPSEAESVGCSPQGWTDADGDPPTYRYSWLVNGVRVSDTPRMNGTGYDKGDQILCEALPLDAYDEGLALRSPVVTVVNSLPVASAGVVSPSPARAGETLSVSGLLTRDDDGDAVTVRTVWQVNRVDTALSPTLDPSLFTTGDQVRARITPNDGEADGAAYFTPVVVIEAAGEARPPRARLTPDAPAWGADDLVCELVESAVFDAGGPPTYNIRWEVDGAPYAGPTGTTTRPGDTISAWDTTRGGRWSCTIEARFGPEVAESEPVEVAPIQDGGNLLILIADDVGVDKVQGYGEHPSAPPTPRLDELAATGVLFRNAYAQPTCSPTRAAIATGRYGRRFGLGKIIDYWDYEPTIPRSERYLPELLLERSAFGYSTAQAGKWHLANVFDAVDSGWDHPRRAGFQVFAGTVGNLADPPILEDSAPLSYNRWEKNTNGSIAVHEVYATIDTVDDAITQMHRMPEPWLMWVSFNAPHTPLHVPPDELHSADGLGAGASDYAKYMAMVESTDTEIGRLLDNVPAEAVERTHILFLGDNGTPKHGITPPFDPEKGKGSVYEGGVNVPLLVAGPAVRTPGESDALVHAVDVFSTGLVLGGVSPWSITTLDDHGEEHPVELDSQSLLPYLANPDRPGQRDVLFVDRVVPNGLGRARISESRAVRDARWKLIVAEEDGARDVSFYDLSGGPVEGVDLTEGGPLTGEALAAYDRLNRRLTEVVAELEPFVPPLRPELASVDVTPDFPNRGDVLTCTPGPTRDPNGDAITLRYEWWLDGELSPVVEPTLSPEHYGDSAEVTCVGYALDGTFESVARRDSVLLEDAPGSEPPELTAVGIGPAELTEATVATCFATAVDPDGDPITLDYTWRVSGVDLDVEGPTLDGRFFDEGDSVRCGVVASAGGESTDIRYSPILNVRNSPPEAPEVELVPAAPVPGESLYCSMIVPGFDLDAADVLRYQVAWQVDGEPYLGPTLTSDLPGDTLPAGVTADGQEWVCTVTPFDEGPGDAGQAAAWVWSSPPAVWPTGLDLRPRNTTCVAPPPPPRAGSVELQPAFAVDFYLDEPTMMTHPPGDDSYFYAFLQDGLIVRFANLPGTRTTEPVLDIRRLVRNVGDEQGGALGIAFHPDFATNGEVFVSYTALGPGGVDDRLYYSRLSRFTSFDGGATLDPSSEEILLNIEQDLVYHNGGHVLFGPDGYLYYSLGDGGGVKDPYGHGPNPFTLFSTIMRLDVDGGFPYAIPEDNPFADGVGGAPEVWAYGFRNPWQFTIDPVSGVMWVGDVGANLIEEIDVVEPGAYYGWSEYEGSDCVEPPCDPRGVEFPVYEWRHVGGAAAIGGVVYRGSRLPELQGKYLFTDYFGGSPLNAITTNPDGSYTTETIIPGTGKRIASFATDLDGEVYLIDHVEGSIWTLGTYEPDPEGGDFPRRLSQTGCVDPVDPTVTLPAMIPYSVNAALWSDGTYKERFFAIPEGTQIELGDLGDFVLPIGSVVKKDFYWDDRPIETRLFMRHEDGEWAGYSYRWREDGSDADLLEGEETRDLGDLVWTYPSRGACFSCHTSVAGITVGLESLQQNGLWTYPNGRTANQLDTFDHLGLFTEALDPASLPTMPGPFDPSADLHDRVAAYAHANCSFCHVEGGGGGGPINLHYLSVDLGECVVPYGSGFGHPDPRILNPGDLEGSVMWQRVSRRDEWQMPPLASEVVDEAFVALLSEYILALPECVD